MIEQIAGLGKANTSSIWQVMKYLRDKTGRFHTFLMFTHVAFYNETYREMMVKHGMIVCISECMVDFYYAEEISKCCGFAGDTLNLAWALRAI